MSDEERLCQEGDEEEEDEQEIFDDGMVPIIGLIVHISIC